jgi:hypothetical protein
MISPAAIAKPVIARSEATTQSSSFPMLQDGLLRFARNDGGENGAK